jgi:hypothetical protein
MGHVISSTCVVVVGVLRVARLTGEAILEVTGPWLVKEGIGAGAFLRTSGDSMPEG